MARQIWIMRHAHAQALQPRHRDFDRALSKAGERQASWVAQEIEHRGELSPPSWVLHSSARRTTQTARLSFPNATKIPDLSLYEAREDGYLQVLQEQAADEDVVALVGHNPSIHNLVSWLSRSQSIRLAEYAPASLTVFQCELRSWWQLQPEACEIVAALVAPQFT